MRAARSDAEADCARWPFAMQKSSFCGRWRSWNFRDDRGSRGKPARARTVARTCVLRLRTRREAGRAASRAGARRTMSKAVGGLYLRSLGVGESKSEEREERRVIILFRFGHGFLVINKSTLTFKNATLISATLHANRRNGILTAFWDGMTTLDGFQTVIFLNSLSLAVGRFFRRQPVGS